MVGDEARAVMEVNKRKTQKRTEQQQQAAAEEA
jgi:hypothetical protein